MNHETRTHLDLFSGIGGFALAARWAGFRTVGFCEIDSYAQQILIKNFGAVMADAKAGQQQQHSQAGNGGQDSGQGSPKIHADIRTLNGADYFGVDLITGGFPCQPYSLSGKRRGTADNRALWPEMRRVVAEARPRWVLGENVPGIINLELDTVLSDLEGIGYAAGTIVVPACAVDAPHRRDRVWIVAHNAGTGQQHDCQVQTWGKQPRRHAACGGGSNVADTTAGGFGTNGRTPWQTGHADECSTALPDTRCQLLERRQRKPAQVPAQWLPEPELGRVAHGIPNRVDRLKCLGNAIVPQVAAEILKAMIQSEEAETCGA